MDNQDLSYMDLGSVSHEYELCRNNNDEPESKSWIHQPSCCLGLPDLPLQSCISAELDKLYDFDKQQDVHHPRDYKGTDARESRKDVERNNEKKHLRSSQVHNSSERRRRHRINGKLKDLQELIPHCGKSDKAYVLDEAVKYIKALQQQVETMATLGRIDCVSPQMQWHTNVSTRFQNPFPFFPTRPGLGMRFGAELTTQIICFACSAPILQFPSTCLPFPYSPSAGFPFHPTTDPTAGYCACARQPFPPVAQLPTNEQQYIPNSLA